MTRKFPIGIQTFSRIRQEGLIYVDKTEQVWLLVKNQDIKDLSSQLNMLISNQSLRYNLSENAKQEVKRFEFYATMRQWDDVINKIDE